MFAPTVVLDPRAAGITEDRAPQDHLSEVDSKRGGAYSRPVRARIHAAEVETSQRLRSELEAGTLDVSYGGLAAEIVTLSTARKRGTLSTARKRGTPADSRAALLSIAVSALALAEQETRPSA